MMKIAINQGQTAFHPGETLSGVVESELSKPTKRLELRLIWFTRGRGTVDVQVVDTKAFDTPTPGARREFTFTLPQSPYSFSGKLLSLVWALELVADGSRDAERVEFVLSPTGQEVSLTAAH